MAQTTVSDFVICTKHLHGDSNLVERVMALAPGDTINLKVEGVVGPWRKMDDGKDGRPTRGIRPIGKMQAWWSELYASRRGAVVAIDIEPVEPTESPAARAAARIIRSEAERQSAISALLELAGKGWRSEGRTVTRDEMHER